MVMVYSMEGGDLIFCHKSVDFKFRVYHSTVNKTCTLKYSWLDFSETGNKTQLFACVFQTSV